MKVWVQRMGITIYDLRFAIYAPWRFRSCGSRVNRKSSIANSLHRVHQRRQSLNANFETIPRFNRSHPAGGAGENHIAGQQGHVRGDKTHQLVAIEDELAGV